MKKLLSIIFTVLYVLIMCHIVCCAEEDVQQQSGAVAAAYIEGNELLNDIQIDYSTLPERYISKIKLLNALEIFSPAEDGSVELERKISREEFTYLAVGLMNKSAAAKECKKQYYSDVEKTRWSAGYIQTATEMGLVHGVGNELFKPEEIISRAQAAKILVPILGYDAGDSFSSDDWIKMANQFGLLKGITNIDALSVADAIEMCINVLEAEMLTVELKGSSLSYTFDDVTALEHYFDIAEVKDCINGVYGAELTSDKWLDEGEMIVGDITATNVSGIAPYEYNGTMVKAYIKDLGDESYEVVYFEDAGVSETMNVNAHDIAGINKSELKYEKDDRYKSIKLDSGLMVVYNNEYLFDYTFEDILPDNGYIRLVDSDGNGKSDIIFVYDYRTVYVSDIDNVSHMIQDYYNDEPILIDEDCIVTVYKEGVLTDVSQITKNSFLNVAVSKSKERCEIRIITEKITGSITSLSDEFIYIDGVEYNISSEFKLYNEKTMQSFGLGRSATFFIDEFGTLSGTTSVVRNGRSFGYFIRMYNNMDDGKIYIKMYTNGGKFVRYELKDRVKVDTARINAEEFYNTYVNIKPQLITFKLNMYEEVTEIEFADTTHQGSSELKGTDEFWLYKSATKTHYVGVRFGGDINLHNQIPVMLVPPEGQEDEEKYYMMSIPALFTDGGSYTFRAYNLDEFNRPQILVVENKWHTNPVQTWHPVFIFTKMQTKLDEDDEVYTYIRGWYDGQEVEYKVENGIDMDQAKKNRGYSDGLKKGDVISLWLNPKNEAYGMARVMHDVGEKYTDLSTYNVSNGNLTYCFAKIKKVGDTHMILTDTKADFVPELPRTRIYVIEDGEVRVGDKSDLIVGRDIFIRQLDGETMEAVIYL